jgi:hypothetical protein
MKTFIGYLIQIKKTLVLFDHPNQLLIKSPDEILRQVKSAEPTNFKWSYLGEDGQILHTEHPFHAIVDENFALAAGLTAGDKIKYTVDETSKKVSVIEVDGLTNWAHETITGSDFLSRIQSRYPNEVIPLDSWGFPSLRVMTARAPVGRGGNVFLQAAGGLGKTSISLEFAESSMRLSYTRPEDRVIILAVGERGPDSTLYSDTADNTPHGDQVEVYNAPAMPELEFFHNQWYIFDYLTTQRSPALGRHTHVTLIIDSLHRVAAAHSLARLSESEGMIGGGFSTESMILATNRTLIAGRYHRGSVTVFSVLLGNIPRNDPKTALAAVGLEAADNVPTAIWSLDKDSNLKYYPAVDVDPYLTISRRMTGFAHPLQVQEYEMLSTLMWTNEGKTHTNKTIAHAALINYCLSHPIPECAARPLSHPTFGKRWFNSTPSLRAPLHRSPNNSACQDCQWQNAIQRNS